MAASVITIVPVVALYMFNHRGMVEGLVAGSVGQRLSPGSGDPPALGGAP